MQKQLTYAELHACRIKAQSVSVIGSVSLNKDGSKEDFRDMRASFTDGGSFQERWLAHIYCSI